MPILNPIRLDIGDVDPALGDGGVADQAFEAADRDRLQRIADRANAFALVLLRAHPAADGRQEVGPGEGVVGAAKILLAELADETGDVDSDRTAVDTGLLRTQQAAFRFAQRILGAETAGHFGEILHPLVRRLLAHRRPLLRNRAYRPLLGHPGHLIRLFDRLRHRQTCWNLATATLASMHISRPALRQRNREAPAVHASRPAEPQPATPQSRAAEST